MGYLISETTKEEREKIVADSLGNRIKHYHIHNAYIYNDNIFLYTDHIGGHANASFNERGKKHSYSIYIEAVNNVFNQMFLQ